MVLSIGVFSDRKPPLAATFKDRGREDDDEHEDDWGSTLYRAKTRMKPLTG
jgi:hypothetical protein